MVSPPHEAMHRIFRHAPGLFSRVSRFLGAGIPTPVKATVLPADLTEASPVERRVDTLPRFETAEQGPFLPAVEVQGRKHRGKPASWVPYTAYLRPKHRPPTALTDRTDPELLRHRLAHAVTAPKVEKIFEDR